MTWEMVFEHLYLVIVSCFFVVAFGIPIGIFTYYHPKAGKIVLTVVDLFQTVPVLAVMGLLMTVFGANSVTVIISTPAARVSVGTANCASAPLS